MTAFDSYLEAARNNQHWGRFVGAFATIVAIWLVASALFLVPIAVYLAIQNPTDPEAIALGFESLMQGGEQSWLAVTFAALVLLSIAVFWPAVWLGQVIMKLPFRAVLSHVSRLRRSRFWHASSVAAVGFGLFLLVGIALEPDKISLTDKFGAFIISTLILTPCIFAQATGEELLFRGWLAQQIGRVARNPWVLGAITSAAFALLHGANPEALKFGPAILLVYFGIGAVLFYAVWREGGLEVAFALHWINNMLLTLVRPSDTDGSLVLGNYTLLIYEGSFSASAAAALGQGIVQIGFLGLMLVLLFARWSPLRLRQPSS